jgi:hypothetical protein
MPEIKRPLILWRMEDDYGDTGYLIDANHTLKDILRHVLLECGDSDEFRMLCLQVYEEEPDGS